jgi:hypothetical protein
MRTTYRTLLLGALCALALSAATSSAASAHEFVVAGSPITKAIEASGTGGTVKIGWFVANVEVPVECKTSTVTNTLEYGGKSKGEYRLTGCKAPGFPKCTVGNIHYTANGGLAGQTGALIDEVAGVRFELNIGNLNEGICVIKGSYPVHGGYICTLPGIETEATEHEFACKGELENSGARFTLSYSNKLSLASGQKWNAL